MGLGRAASQDPGLLSGPLVLLDGIRSLAAGLRTSVHAIHPHDDEYHYTIRGQVRERPKGITLKDLPPKDDLEGVAEVPISRAPS